MYEIFEQLCQERGISIYQFSKFTGIAQSTLSDWKRGVSKPKNDKIKKIADYFGVSVSYLRGETDTKNAHTEGGVGVTDDIVTFPILGEVAAGYEHIAYEDWTGEKIDVPRSFLKGKRSEDYFALRVLGESMYPLYRDGDVVIVLRQASMDRSGSVGVVMYEDDRATLKKVEYVEGENWMRLVPVNPLYPPILIEGEQLEHCRILGLPKILVREIRE